MKLEIIKGRAELPDREWVEIEAHVDAQGVVGKVLFKAWGCHSLIDAAEDFAKTIENKKLSELDWPGVEHWNLLLSEALLKIKGQFALPITEEELCHCRKIPTSKVDNAIVLGAQTPERVRAWTSASSGCGTCRPNVEKLISYRLKKAL